MGTKNAPNRPVKSVETAFGIIEAIQDENGASVTELAQNLGMSQGTVHSHLSTLKDRGYVVKDEGGDYRIGLTFLNHGMHAKRNFEHRNIHLRSVLDQLAAETSEVAWFVTKQQGYGIYLERSAGEHSVPTPSRIGMSRQLHSTATGKAILAHMPEERVHEIFESYDVKQFTDHTISDIDNLLKELETVREQGVAFNEEELIRGLRAVAAPIIVDGDIRGSVGVSGPTNRMRGERFRQEIPNLVLGTVNEIELKIQHSSISDV